MPTLREVEVPLKSKKAAPAVILVVLIAISLFAVFNSFRGALIPNFYVGVEFAYSHDLNSSQVILSDLKSLVNKVADYTNFFIIGIPEVSLNRTLLDESCDYINGKGLSVIVLYKDTTKYPYNLSQWTSSAAQKYGSKFIGVYRIDEPGGKELDNATFGGQPDRFLDQRYFEPNVRNYTHAATLYVDILRLHIEALKTVLYPRIFTSDYGLYWFDYKSGYESVFGEFVWNNSRNIAVSACRGAAQVQGRDWGIMITWMYNTAPYIESAGQLYDDLVLAYKAGPKYVAVFNYPALGEYGILTEAHFEALKNFWDYAKANPQDYGSQQGMVAYVLPRDYGFGLRRPDDTIWGVWNADELAPKVWEDTNKLVGRYGLSLDIVFDDPEFISSVMSRYEKLFFWNETVNP